MFSKVGRETKRRKRGRKTGVRVSYRLKVRLGQCGGRFHGTSRLSKSPSVVGRVWWAGEGGRGGIGMGGKEVQEGEKGKGRSGGRE